VTNIDIFMNYTLPDPPKKNNPEEFAKRVDVFINFWDSPKFPGEDSMFSKSNQIKSEFKAKVLANTEFKESNESIYNRKTDYSDNSSLSTIKDNSSPMDHIISSGFSMAAMGGIF